MSWHHLIRVAWEKRDWETLGYDSWDSYVGGEFSGAARVGLAAPQRRELVDYLRNAEGGMSTRAIASAVGVSKSAVARDLATSGVPSGTPDPSGDRAGGPVETEIIDAEIVEDESTPGPSADRVSDDTSISTTVTGVDGKHYTVPTPAPRQQRRRPLTDVARDKGFELRKSMESIERIFDDNRYRENSEQICSLLRGHLMYVQETAAAYLDQMPAREGDHR